MNASQLKTILDSVVHPDHRNFSLTFSRKKTRGRMGTYFFKRQLIVIYLPLCVTDIRIISTGLHELAHHVVWETYKDIVRSRKTRLHGVFFTSRLTQILNTFNNAYGKKMKGGFAFNKGRPSIVPTFREFPTARE